MTVQMRSIKDTITYGLRKAKKHGVKKQYGTLTARDDRRDGDANSSRQNNVN